MDKEVPLKRTVSDLLTTQKLAIKDLIVTQEATIKKMQEQNNIMERKILVLEEEVRKLKAFFNCRL